MPAFTAPASTAILSGMIDDATTAAAAAARASASARRDRSAIAIVTAVLDTSPPTAPGHRHPAPLAQQPHRHESHERERGDQHHHHPDLARVPDLPRTESPVGQAAAGR